MSDDTAARWGADRDETSSGDETTPPSLDFPPPPRREQPPADTYPEMPRAGGDPPGWERGARAGAPEKDGRPKVAAIAMVAALLGALLGTGGMLLYVEDRMASGTAEPQASPVADPADAGRVEIEGAVEDLDRVATVAEAVLPSVVQVNIRGGGLVSAAGNGSGVVYRGDGHIITNNHVVAEATELEVLLADGSRVDAEIVGTDADTDLAVIKVDNGALTPIELGDSSALRVGELAVAVGSPFGLEGTVTSGVISSLNRQIRIGGPDGSPLILPNVIQTDAPINPGNSGGALVSGDGRLIGINSAILTQGGTAANAGVGFAIPVNIAVEIADQLIDQGFVQHPFLGVAGIDVTNELAGRVGVEDGAYIEQVVPDTPAARAGLREGDVIVSLAGEPIDSMQDLIAAVLRQDVGDSVEITYIRDGQERTTDVTLAEKPPRN